MGNVLKAWLLPDPVALGNGIQQQFSQDTPVHLASKAEI